MEWIPSLVNALAALSDGYGSAICKFGNFLLEANSFYGVTKIAWRYKIFPQTVYYAECYVCWCLVSKVDNKRKRAAYYVDPGACVSYAYIAIEWPNEISKFPRNEQRFDKPESRTCIQYNGVQ